jgi:hypothetical protein
MTQVRIYIPLQYNDFHQIYKYALNAFIYRKSATNIKTKPYYHASDGLNKHAGRPK